MIALSFETSNKYDAIFPVSITRETKNVGPKQTNNNLGLTEMRIERNSPLKK